MPKQRIDRVALHRMLTKEGKSAKEAAEFFGVSTVAIWKAKRELNISVIKSAALEAGHKIVTAGLDTFAQLEKINLKTNVILDGLMEEIERGEASQDKKKDIREIALKASQEIRGQLSLQLEVLRALFDLRAMNEFQAEVLQSIAEVAPDVRARIISNLKKRRVIRNLIELS